LGGDNWAVEVPASATPSSTVIDVSERAMKIP
jgi:hypothetical protein